MDRRRSQVSSHQCTVCSDRLAALELLLRGYRTGCYRPFINEAGRRSVYSLAVLRFSKSCCSPTARRAYGESEANSRHHASTWPSRTIARPCYFGKLSGTSQVSLLASRSQNCQTLACLECRHYVYPLTSRVCVPSGYHRLGQSIGAGQPVVEQSREFILCGSCGRSLQYIWTSRDFQYGSRRAIYKRGIRTSHTQSPHSTEHGRTRKSLRQCIRRETLEITEVRRGISE